MKPVIEVIGLEKLRVLGKAPAKALGGIELKVENEDFLVAVRASSNGKPTLLNMIGVLGVVLTLAVFLSALAFGIAARYYLLLISGLASFKTQTSSSIKI